MFNNHHLITHLKVDVLPTWPQLTIDAGMATNATAITNAIMM